MGLLEHMDLWVMMSKRKQKRQWLKWTEKNLKGDNSMSKLVAVGQEQILKMEKIQRSCMFQVIFSKMITGLRFLMGIYVF